MYILKLGYKKNGRSICEMRTPHREKCLQFFAFLKPVADPGFRNGGG